MRALKIETIYYIYINFIDNEISCTDTYVMKSKEIVTISKNRSHLQKFVIHYCVIHKEIYANMSSTKIWSQFQLHKSLIHIRQDNIHMTKYTWDFSAQQLLGIPSVDPRCKTGTDHLIVWVHLDYLFYSYSDFISWF